jgi:hypothetical protein
MDKLIIEKLIEDIQAQRKQYYMDKISPYPRRNFYASDIWDCDRYMVYGVLNWEDRLPTTWELHERFEAGNDAENKIVALLRKWGFDVIHTQMPIEVKNRQGEIICTGRIEGKIKHDGELVPFEAKLMMPYKFKGINSVEDMNKDIFYRKYPRQMGAYLYGQNKEQGLFIITDGVRLKFIPIYLEYETMEWILQRLERNWEHVKNKTLPDRIEYKSKMCGKCPFNHVCLPDMKAQGEGMITDDELEQDLTKWWELKEAKQEYDSLDKSIKSQVEGRQFLLGEFQVGGKYIERSSYSVPKEVSEKYKTTKKVWIKKIDRLEKK